MERGLNKITGTDKQTIEMLKDKVLSGGGGGSGGALGISFSQTNEEIEGVMTKTITTEITDLSSVNFVLLTTLDLLEFETFTNNRIVVNQICPVIARTSSQITFKILIYNEDSFYTVEITLDLVQGISSEESAQDMEGNASLKLYSL